MIWGAFIFVAAIILSLDKPGYIAMGATLCMCAGIFLAVRSSK